MPFSWYIMVLESKYGGWATFNTLGCEECHGFFLRASEMNMQGLLPCACKAFYFSRHLCMNLDKIVFAAHVEREHISFFQNVCTCSPCRYWTGGSRARPRKLGNFDSYDFEGQWASQPLFSLSTSSVPVQVFPGIPLLSSSIFRTHVFVQMNIGKSGNLTITDEQFRTNHDFHFLGSSARA